MNIREARSRLSKLQKEIESQRLLVSQGQKTLSALEREQKELTVFLNTPSQVIGVSDHALIRYLERKYGFNFQQYRDEILTPDRVSAIQAGAQTITANGIKMKVDKNTIVTVLGA